MQQGDATHPIVSLMREHGRRQDWLARVTGYTAPYLSKVFHKHLPATVQVRAACAKALGIPEQVLFHDDSNSAEAA